MKKQVILLILTTIISQTISAQIKTRYIKKESFTKIVTINESCNHAEEFVNINVFDGELDKVKWGTATYIISYQYLGVDNQNNLHVKRTVNDYVLNDKETCDLIFRLETNKPTEISLIGQANIKSFIIKVQVEATNNYIKTKYIGDLPIYGEN